MAFMDDISDSSTEQRDPEDSAKQSSFVASPTQQVLGLGDELDVQHGDLSLAGRFLGTGKAREIAAEQAEAAQTARNFIRAQGDVLQADIQPLQERRDVSLDQLLGLIKGEDVGFALSPERTAVLGAAEEIAGGVENPQVRNALLERAQRLADAEMGNFNNRIGVQAGVSQSGLGQTNRLLQQNINTQSGLITDVANSAASGLIGAANQSQQAGTSALGLLGSLSDYRLKENAVEIGTDSNGRTLYEWNWKEGFEHITEGYPTQGYMAHELLKSDPLAVYFGSDGYMRIHEDFLNGGH